MTNGGRLPWLRLVAEGVLIVASILSALAVDTFWSGLQDRRLESAELQGIFEQLETTKRRLEETIRADESLLGTTERLLAVLEAAGDGTAPVLDSLLRAQGGTTLFVAPLSRFDALLASGRLVLIEDPDLRAAIAEWPTLVGGITEVAVRRRDFYETEFLAHLRDRYDLTHFLGSEPPIGNLVEIPVDDAFRNLVRERRFFDRVLLIRQQALLERLEGLMDYVRQALPESALYVDDEADSGVG